MALLKWSGFGMLALAFFLSVVALRSDSEANGSVSNSTNQRFSVVVARELLGPGREIRSSDVVVAEAFERPRDAFGEVAALVGRTPVHVIEPGAILRESSLVPLGALTRVLQAGETAVAVEIDRVTGLGGFVRPGDAVDVLLLLQRDGREIQRTEARTLLLNARVLALGEELESASPDEPMLNAHTAVLAVREEDAPVLLLADVVGTLRLAVRSASTEGSVEKHPRTSLEELLGLQRQVSPKSTATAKPMIPIIRGTGIRRGAAP